MKPELRSASVSSDDCCLDAWQRKAVLCRLRTFLSMGRMTTGSHRIIVQLENSSCSVAVPA